MPSRGPKGRGLSHPLTLRRDPPASFPCQSHDSERWTCGTHRTRVTLLELLTTNADKAKHQVHEHSSAVVLRRHADRQASLATCASGWVLGTGRHRENFQALEHMFCAIHEAIPRKRLDDEPIPLPHLNPQNAVVSHGRERPSCAASTPAASSASCRNIGSPLIHPQASSSSRAPA